MKGQREKRLCTFFAWKKLMITDIGMIMEYSWIGKACALKKGENKILGKIMMGNGVQEAIGHGNT